MNSSERRIFKWKGVKRGDLVIPDPHSKEFWEAFFTDYIKPICEIDNAPLECVKINISRFANPAYGYGIGRRSIHLSKSELIIEVELKCPVCGTEYSGIGSDIEMGEDGSIGLGSFKIHTTKINIPG